MQRTSQGVTEGRNLARALEGTPRQLGAEWGVGAGHLGR